jgi:NAD(P)-dependent dehydrogenase (short-subunit alcohol dehydrogenase family)
MSGLLEGKVGLVTGAGAGIGRAAAVVCAAEGAVAVVVADIDESGGRETVQRVSSAGAESMFVSCDVSRREDVQALVESTCRAYGRLDFAINNAGITHSNTRLADLEEVEFDRVMAVNLKGVWFCLKYEIAAMLKTGGGAIVNTASRNGLRGSAVAGGYAASKHGVIGLTRSAAVGYVDDGIRVNCVCPGVVLTPLSASIPAERLEQLRRSQPGERMAEPEEIAEAAVWLCSDRASFVSGASLPVDNSWTAGG